MISREARARGVTGTWWCGRSGIDRSFSKFEIFFKSGENPKKNVRFMKKFKQKILRREGGGNLVNKKIEKKIGRFLKIFWFPASPIEISKKI